MLQLLCTPLPWPIKRDYRLISFPLLWIQVLFILYLRPKRKVIKNFDLWIELLWYLPSWQMTRSFPITFALKGMISASLCFFLTFIECALRFWWQSDFICFLPCYCGFFLVCPTCLRFYGIVSSSLTHQCHALSKGLRLFELNQI